MVAVLDYSEGETLLHRANPVAKVAFALLVCVAVFLADSFLALAAFLVLMLVVACLTGLGRRIRALVLGLGGLGAAIFLVQTLVVRGGDPLVLWFTQDGVVSGIKVALRLVCFALPLVLMLMVTRLSDLANAAVQILRVPYRYAFTVTTALRFVPIFAGEMSAIMEAQTARGVEFDTPNPLKKLRLMLPLVMPLVISSVAKADATALAAEERGFHLRTRSSSFRRYPFSPDDVALLAVGVLLVVMGAFF